MSPESKEHNSDLTAFTSKIQVFCRPECTKGVMPWKRILIILKYKDEYHKQLRAEKLDENKIWSWDMILKLPKIVHFLPISADLIKKSERPYHFFSQTCFIVVWATVHGILKCEISGKVADSAEIQEYPMLISSKSQYEYKFWQFKDHISGRIHEKQTNNPIFSSTFRSLTV